VLPSLWIRNFRALEDFHVPTLGRVNLIVGKNNTGKSSILEALHVYAQNANPSLLNELLIGHDEVLRSLNQPGSPTEADEQIPYQNFFSGRTFPKSDDVSLYIGDREETHFVRIAHTYYIEEGSTDTEGDISIKRIPVRKTDIPEETGQALLISSSRREHPRWMTINEGPSPGFRLGRVAVHDPLTIPVGIVPTGLLPSARLADLWDSIALTNFDEIVRDGLRIIESRVEGIAFVKRDASRLRSEPDRAAIVKLAGVDRPVALNSMGDGMVRVLQLLLALIPARGGLYLVDEFENGLHYSVQEKVWQLLFELAKLNDVQIFAATHSWDCIEAFKNVASRAEDPAVLFRIGQSIKTSDKGKMIATVFDRDALARLTQADVELR